MYRLTSRPEHWLASVDLVALSTGWVWVGRPVCCMAHGTLRMARAPALMMLKFEAPAQSCIFFKFGFQLVCLSFEV